MKIYIHHKYNKGLFFRFLHNTTERTFKTNSNNEIVVNCLYNENPIEIIFSEEFNSEEDAYHIVDYYEVLLTNKLFGKECKFTKIVDDITFLQSMHSFIKEKDKWIITLIRNEKLISEDSNAENFHTDSFESNIKKLSNTLIVHDNYFLNETLKKYYKNNFFSFSNTIMQWNQDINIRYYFEFKNIFEKLNFEYDLCFSMRFVRTHRIEILKKLKHLNNPKILLQRTDSQIVTEYERLGKKYFDKYKDILSEIKLNSILGDNDFSNLTWIEYVKGVNFDLFFRLLSKSKMQILDETHSLKDKDFNSMYISEKTIGLILAGIPFISTHSYPLEILQRILNIEPHPFIENFKKHKGNTTLFVKFVEKFMENFDENYILCKEWSDKAHILFMNKLNSENSLLELLINGYTLQESIKKNKLI